MDAVTVCLQKVIHHPHDPELQFELATLYFKEEQYAQAFTHFLRCTDCTRDPTLISECLLAGSKVMCKHGDRSSKEYGLILHSLSMGTKNPEPYYTKSLYHSWRGEWMECYTVTCLALSTLDSFEPTFRNTELFSYTGYTDLLYQKALSAYHRGKYDEAKGLYIKLSLLGVNVSYDHVPNVDIPHIRNDYNNSQIFQDVFVENVTCKMKNGTYLEIGANDYKHGNNTFLLEQKYDWKGVSIELIPEHVATFNRMRSNECICTDALQVDYSTLLSKYDFFREGIIDYLQLDIEPSNNTYEVLLKIPFDEYRFRVITYEHDHYVDATQTFRTKSREYLTSKGYVLVVGDITPDTSETRPFEDWWVHPDLVPEYRKFLWHDTTPVCGERYMDSVGM